MIVHVLLAAGRSTRMGQPKALLPFDDETLIERMIATSIRSAVDTTIVVLGHEADRIRPIVERSAAERAGPDRAQVNRTEVRIVENIRYDEGQTTSLQCAIRALSADVEALVNLPLDFPGVTSGDIDAIIEAYRSSAADRVADGAAIVTATHDGRRGRPTLFARPLFAEILALAPEAPARALLDRVPGRVLDVELSNPYILEDMDTPDDYERHLAGLDLGRPAPRPPLDGPRRP